MNEDVIYISVNNWFCGRDYPPLDCFKKWLGDDLNQTFRNDEWAKSNKLCIYYGVYDMSQSYTISAPREWVENNCPELLTDEEFTYYTVIHRPKKKKLFGGYEYEDIKEEHKKKYSDFVHHPEAGESIPDNDYFDMPFREYCPENYGSKYYELNYWDNDEDESDNYEDDE